MFEREPFVRVQSRVIPLPLSDVDTDQISPGHVTLATEPDALAHGLFRYRRDEDPDFVLDRPGMQGRSILLAGPNFGCGSSRESAVWALQAWGIRVVLSTSFGEIFQQNALKNGLLAIAIDRDGADTLWQRVGDDPVLVVDLEAQRVAVGDDGLTLEFEIDPFAKHLLLNGLDELSYLLALDDAITTYEASPGVHVMTRSRLEAVVPIDKE